MKLIPQKTLRYNIPITRDELLIRVQDLIKANKNEDWFESLYNEYLIDAEIRDGEIIIKNRYHGRGLRVTLAAGVDEAGVYVKIIPHLRILSVILILSSLSAFISSVLIALPLFIYGIARLSYFQKTVWTEQLFEKNLLTQALKEQRHRDHR